MNNKQRRATSARQRKIATVGWNNGPVYGVKGAITGSNRSRPFTKRSPGIYSITTPASLMLYYFKNDVNHLFNVVNRSRLP